MYMCLCAALTFLAEAGLGGVVSSCVAGGQLDISTGWMTCAR